MGKVRLLLLTSTALILFGTFLHAQESSPADAAAPTQGNVEAQLSLPASGPGSFDHVIDRVVEREHFFMAQMRHVHPLAETYIQNMKTDKELGSVPECDQYF